MNDKYWFLIDYKCNEAEAGKQLVTAKSALEAFQLFINDWNKNYIKDEIGYINPYELESFKITKLCNNEDIMF